MENVLDYLSAALLLLGSFFVVVGGIGVLRMPDVFTRMHAAGVTDTMGSFFILTGLMLQTGFDGVTLRLAMILGFLWFTSPVATHALAKAALHGKVEPIVHEDERGD
ncbi:MAG: monovalent cation/H(+) antiporter subunit G [Gammaproteobacteria bacterium]|nr:monovalent cation/H(+) antiporter subunit G [Gammaproteobacteria bacterium]